MTLHVLQHVAHEGPGLLAGWAAARSYALRLHPVFAAPHALPGLAARDGLVLLGGPMSVHDAPDLPWLAAEKAYLRTALAAGHRVLGICLGAQLLAEALGARITDGPALEIGWFPVELSAAARQLPLLAGAAAPLVVLHWHGETFSLPPDAVLLGHSTACENQGFVWQSQAVGVQFHPEIDARLLAQMLHHEGHELAGGGPFVQTAGQLTAGLAAHGAGAKAWLFALLDELFS